MKLTGATLAVHEHWYQAKHRDVHPEIGIRPSTGMFILTWEGHHASRLLQQLGYQQVQHWVKFEALLPGQLQEQARLALGSSLLVLRMPELVIACVLQPTSFSH